MGYVNIKVQAVLVLPRPSAGKDLGTNRSEVRGVPHALPWFLRLWVSKAKPTCGRFGERDAEIDVDVPIDAQVYVLR